MQLQEPAVQVAPTRPTRCCPSPTWRPGSSPFSASSRCITLLIVSANVANLMLGRAVSASVTRRCDSRSARRALRIVRMLVCRGCDARALALGAACACAWWTSRALLRSARAAAGLARRCPAGLDVCRLRDGAGAAGDTGVLDGSGRARMAAASAAACSRPASKVSSRGRRGSPSALVVSVRARGAAGHERGPGLSLPCRCSTRATWVRDRQLLLVTVRAGQLDARSSRGERRRGTNVDAGVRAARTRARTAGRDVWRGVGHLRTAGSGRIFQRHDAGVARDETAAARRSFVPVGPNYLRTLGLDADRGARADRRSIAGAQAAPRSSTDNSRESCSRRVAARADAARRRRPPGS